MSQSEPSAGPRSAEALRAEIESADNAILDLLGRRMRAVEALAAAENQSFPIRAARDTMTLRRLVAAAADPVEDDLVIELWRVLIGASTRRLGPVDVAVAGGADPVRLFDVARRHFGARTRIHRLPDPASALRRAVEAPTPTVAVVPWPTASGAGTWWPTLSESRFHKLALIAGLPMRGPREAEPEAGVFALNAPLEPAGGDVTLAIAHDPHHRATKTLTDAGFAGREVARSEPRVLFRIEGYVAPDDIRVSTLARGGLDGFRIVGSYARV